MKNIFRILKNESGMALAVVLMVVVVFAILGVALLGLAAGNTKLATINRTNQSSYYIAEAGVSKKISEIQGIVTKTRNDLSNQYPTGFESHEFDYFTSINNSISALTDNSYSKFNGVNGTPPEATNISVLEGSPGSCTVESNLGVCNPQSYLDNCVPYTIKSTGKIADEQTTVSQDFRVCFNFWLPNTTIFSTSQNVPAIKLNGAGEIVGTAGTSAGSGAIQVGGNNGSKAITDTVFYSGTVTPNNPVVVDNNKYTYTIQQIDPVTVYLPPFPKYPDLPLASPTPMGGVVIDNLGNLTINGSGGSLDLSQAESYLKSITVGTNEVLTINTQDSDKILRVGSLDVKGTIKVNGTGKLKIYVDTSLKFYNKNNDITQLNPNGHPEDLSVYYAGDQNNLTLLGQINAGIYVDHDDFTIGDNSNFYGPIISRASSKINYNGTTTYAIFVDAPKSDFIMNGNSKITSKIIVNTYTSDGSNSVLTDPHDNNYQQSPLFPDNDLILSSPLREIK